MKDSKQMAKMLVAKMDKPSKEDDQSMEKDGKMQAAKEIMSAMKSGDAQALSDALHSFYQMC